MTREQFHHVIRAAAAVLNVDELLVIGSQAVLASTTVDVRESRMSIEADIAVLGDEDGSRADTIDGTIGELSMFQDMFGYYAQGVSARTATLPDGWAERLIRYAPPATNGVTALCLEIHDLWLSKAVAGRPKDREFCASLVARGLVDADTLAARLADIRGLDAAKGEVIRSLIPGSG